MFGLDAVNVFDPSSMMRRAIIAQAIPLVAVWLLGPVAGVAGLVAVLFWLVYLSRTARAAVTAVVVRATDIEHVALLDATSTNTEVTIRSGVVVRIDRNLRPHSPVRLPPGRRVIQLLLNAPSTRYMWIDASRKVEITHAEAVGALSIVLSGDDVHIDCLVGAVPGNPHRPLAVNTFSSTGSVVSFDPIITSRKNILTR